jgi:hypothetical protein
MKTTTFALVLGTTLALSTMARADQDHLSPRLIRAPVVTPSFRVIDIGLKTTGSTLVQMQSRLRQATGISGELAEVAGENSSAGIGAAELMYPDVARANTACLRNPIWANCWID